MENSATNPQPAMVDYKIKGKSKTSKVFENAKNIGDQINQKIEPNRRNPFVQLVPLHLNNHENSSSILTLSSPSKPIKGVDSKTKGKPKRRRRRPLTITKKHGQRLQKYPLPADYQRRKAVCPVCHRRFNCQVNLTFHLQIHRGKNPLSCPVCTTNFQTYVSLKCHFARQHPEDPAVQADPNFNRYLNHIEKRSYPKRKKYTAAAASYQCPHCPKSFLYKGVLNAHVLSTHKIGPIPARPHKCEICESTFLNVKGLEHHLIFQACQTIIAKKISCHLCEYVTSRKSELKSHLKCFHGIPKPLRCSICQKVFRTEIRKAKHELSHGDEYPCPFCSKAFKSKNGLGHHKHYYHPNELKTFTCHPCGIHFPTLWSQSNHLRNCRLLKEKSLMSSKLPDFEMPDVLQAAAPMENTKPNRRKQNLKTFRGSIPKLPFMMPVPISTSSSFTSLVTDTNLPANLEEPTGHDPDKSVVDSFSCTPIFQIKTETEDHISSWIRTVSDNPTASFSSGCGDVYSLFPEVIPTTVLKMEP